MKCVGREDNYAVDVVKLSENVVLISITKYNVQHYCKACEVYYEGYG